MSTLSTLLNRSYPVRIDELPKEDGGGYVASMLDFGVAFCSGSGESPQEAIESLTENKRFVFETVLGANPDFRFPEPSPLVL